MNPVQKAINNLLVPRFSKVGASSWKAALSPEVTAIVELQRSAWDAQNYVNVGFWLSSVDAAPTPRRSDACHIYGRLEDVVDIDSGTLGELLNGDVAFTDDQRQIGIARLLAAKLEHLFDASSTETGLAHYLASRQSHAILAQPEVRARMGLETP